MSAQLARKQLPTVQSLINEDEAYRLLHILEFSWRDTLETMHALVAQTFDLDPLTFRLDDAHSRRFLEVVRFRAKGISDTTRELIQGAIRDGQERGDSLEAITATVDQLLAESAPWRARQLARTEIGQAQRDSALDRYKASGLVDRVLAIDGDQDECASRNGKTYPLADAPDLLHPNCSLLLIPILRAGVI